MRSSYVALAVMSLSNSAAAVAQSCSHVAGALWTDNYGHAISLSQSPSNAITGTLTRSPALTPCPAGNVWPVVGTFQNGGEFLFIATNPSGVFDGYCLPWVQYHAEVVRPGCHTTSWGSWVNSLGQTNPWRMTKGCDTPGDESSFFQAWVGTQATFGATITGSAYNLGGREVTEQDPGGGGPDTCYFSPGSAVDPFESVTGGYWPVASDNTYGGDLIGWSSGAVQFYRDHHGTGIDCGTRFQQRMVIDCSSNTRPYAINEITIRITANNVVITRDGVSAP